MPMPKITLLVTDVDGTLTDGKLYIGESGECFKVFSIKDGLGIKEMLARLGIQCAVITGRQSKIVAARCAELGVKYLFQNVSDKASCLRKLMHDLKLNQGEIAYIGDDLNDLDAMKLCALKGCPANAAEEVKAVCDFVSTHNGGDGAVRDFIEYLGKQLF